MSYTKPKGLVKSNMPDITIYPRFEKLLRPLSAAEESELRALITRDGCTDSLKVWKGKLADGHNRLRICTEENLTYKTEDISERFATEDEVEEWIIRHQIARRNLNSNEQTYFIGKLYNIEKKRVGRPIESKNDVGVDRSVLPDDDAETQGKPQPLSGGAKAVKQTKGQQTRIKENKPGQTDPIKIEDSGETVITDISRLEYYQGKPDGSVIEVKGDIASSRSVASIAEKGIVISPFEHDGKQYVSTGSSHDPEGCSFTAYELVPASSYQGVPIDHKKFAESAGERPDRRSYDRVKVSFNKEPFILSGPPIEFESDASTLPDGAAFSYTDAAVAAKTLKDKKRTSQKIAEEHGVSEKTVRRAAAVAEAADNLPVESFKKFLTGATSKAEVLRKSLTDVTPVEKKVSAFEPGQNARTLLITNKANRIELALISFKRKLGEIFNASADDRNLPKPIADLKIKTEKNLADLENDCLILKHQFVCEACAGESCSNCVGGFVGDKVRRSQLIAIKDKKRPPAPESVEEVEKLVLPGGPGKFNLAEICLLEDCNEWTASVSTMTSASGMSESLNEDYPDREAALKAATDKVIENADSIIERNSTKKSVTEARKVIKWARSLA